MDALEERAVPSTITWVNQGQASDNFGATFGSRASLARAVVNAAINSWTQAVTNFNQPGGGDNINVFITMGEGGYGGSTSITAGDDGWPTAAAITLGSGPNGNGAGDFLDPTPVDLSAFGGTIVNPYSGDAQAGSPAAGKIDLYTIALHELCHALGFVAGSRLQTTGYATDTGVLDTPGKPALGYLWVFDGPGVTHLLTSDNNGTSDAGGPEHSAFTNQVVTWHGQTVQGAEDLMNGGTGPSERRLIPDYIALMLHDAYNYTIAPVASFPTFYAGFNSTSNNGNLLIRGGNSANGDTITLSSASSVGGPLIGVSVDIGDPVPGTAPDPTYTQSFPASQVTSITIAPGSGTRDVVDIESTLAGAPVTVNLGTSTNTVEIDPTAKLLDDIQGSVSINDGDSSDSLDVWDSNAQLQETYTISSSAVSRSGAAMITYGTIGNVNLLGGSAARSSLGGDTYNIESTPSGTIVAVEGNSGADTFNISPTAESLATIQGHLAVTGDADGNTVNIYDQTHSGNDTYTLASSSKVSSSVTRTGTATISYGSDKALNLYGGSGNGTYNIDGTPSGTAVTITGGSGNDTFNVSPTAKNLGALSGNLTVLGEDGFNTLNIDDQNNSANDTYTLASSSQVSSTISRTGAAKISYASLGAVNLFGGNGKDNYNVNGTPTGTFVGLIGGSGNDTFNMTPTSKNLANIQSGVAVVGETGSNTLNIDDQDNSATVVYSLDSDGVETSVVTRAGAANISYYALGAVNLYGGSGNDTYVVNGTPSGTAVSINGGNGNDDFELNSLRDVTGKINGGGGTNTLDYTDYSGNSPITVNLQSGQAAGTGGFAKIQQLIGSPKVATTLVGANKTNTWSITGTNAGTVNAFAFSGVGYLTGGTGMDVFVFGDGTDLTGVINAGGGDNWLDYAAYSTAVAVNLTLDTATGTLGVVNIENVRGGQGANDLTGDAQGGITQGNILIGGMGANTIMGGTGKSILIGGKGRDSVTGGSGSDVLIAGYAKYDSSTLANDMALESILNEWKSGDSYAMRISKIKSGVGPSSADKLAWGSSVFDNGTANTNTLTGAGGKNGANWFFANMAHTTTNKTANEKLN